MSQRRLRLWRIAIWTIVGAVVGAIIGVLGELFPAWIWTIVWCAWFLAFLAIELPAATNKVKRDTLSEHIWLILFSGIWALRFGFVAFTAWLIIHIYSHGWI
jgi:hypothetical protein